MTGRFFGKGRYKGSPLDERQRFSACGRSVFRPYCVVRLEVYYFMRLVVRTRFFVRLQANCIGMPRATKPEDFDMRSPGLTSYARSGRSSGKVAVSIAPLRAQESS